MDNQELFNKLNSLRGKYEFLKAQKDENDSKKKQLMEELVKLNVPNMDGLRKLIEKSTKEVESKEKALISLIQDAENQAKLLEAKVKGQIVQPLPEIVVGMKTEPNPEVTL